MREQGTIIHAHATKLALIAFPKRAVCEKCGLCSALDNGQNGLEAFNPVQAKIGDMVEVEIPSLGQWENSFDLFLVPAIIMVIGYWLGLHLLGEIWGIIIGLAIGAKAFMMMRRNDHFMRLEKSFQARVTKLVKQAEGS